MPKRKLRASDSDSEPLAKKKERLLLELKALRRKESQRRSPTPLSEFSDHSNLSNESLSDGSFQDSTQVPFPTTEVEIPSELPSEADPEIALLLGDVPSTKDLIFGKPVLQPLADRWEKYLMLGVEKSDKEVMEKKYPPPKNIPLLRAPLLNPELESSIPAVSAKADKYLATMQRHLGTGLTALSEVIDKILTGSVVSEPKTDILPAIVAASKIFCDVFNMMSSNRKYNVEGHLNPTVKKIVRESRPDEYLCGNSFADKYKEAKNQWRTGREMKKFSSAVVKNSSFPSSRYSAHKIQQMPGTSRQDGSLNFQRGYLKTRMKGRQQHRQQYSRERPMSTENSEKRGIYSNRNFRK